MSGADVCLDMGYDEDNEFFAEKVCKARKEHTCCECGEPIAKGAKYERVNGKSDGVFWSYATCLVCLEVRNAFVCGTYVFEMLWETIREEMFPAWNASGPWDCLAKLTTDEARAKCNTEYREYREWNHDDDAPTGGHDAAK